MVHEKTGKNIELIQYARIRHLHIEEHCFEHDYQVRKHSFKLSIPQV